jgi:hypothetical protein
MLKPGSMYNNRPPGGLCIASADPICFTACTPPVEAEKQIIEARLIAGNRRLLGRLDAGTKANAQRDNVPLRPVGP